MTFLERERDVLEIDDVSSSTRGIKNRGQIIDVRMLIDARE